MATNYTTPAQQFANGSGAFPSIALSGNTITALAPLDELAQQLEGARERIRSASRNVQAIADNLFGSLPEGGQTDGPKVGRSGRLGSLNEQAEYIHKTIFELEQQINRLASLSSPTETSPNGR